MIREVYLVKLDNKNHDLRQIPHMYYSELYCLLGLALTAIICFGRYSTAVYKCSRQNYDCVLPVDPFRGSDTPRISSHPHPDKES